MNIFPTQELTEQEEHLLKEIFCHPSVKKYLHTLAYNIGRDMILANSLIQEDPAKYLRIQTRGQGALDLVDTLLSSHQLLAETFNQE